MAYRMTTRRKLAIASWAAPREGNIYGQLTLDVDRALAFLEDLRVKTGKKVTITHMIGKAVGLALSRMPDLNGQIVLGRYVPHQSVDISFLVQLSEGKDLAKVKIENVHQLSLLEIAERLQGGAGKLQKGEDKDFEKSKGLLKLLPTWLIRPIVQLIGYATSVLGIGVPALGLESRPFGTCIITSIGMLGLDAAYAPPTPFAHVPFYVTVPRIVRRPVVEGDDIVIRQQLDLTATLDHRFLDGFQGAVIAKTVREYFANPEKFEPAVPESPVRPRQVS